MNKYKIFHYELRRVIFAKGYVFLLILILLYSSYTIKTSVLHGYANTAPFSEWSFIQYLLSITPFLSTILLFYLSKLYSPSEKKVMNITSSMKFSGPLYFFIKISVVAIAYLFATLLALIVCFIFYGKVFGFYDYKNFMSCILLVLIPQLVLILGIGLWISKINYNFSYVLIALIFILSLKNDTSSYYLDFLGSSIMKIPMNQIPVKGVIAYVIPNDYIVSRVLFSIIGISLILIGCMRYNMVRGEKIK